ncbi:hypothetical protein BDR04DRAFT_1068035 [Suillus decipiens]|nr:hypothetical protein BDR04DRAFT_1068035 [Suillus decipiens]
MLHPQFQHVLTVQYFTMAGKRKRNKQGPQIHSFEELEKVLLENITTYKSAEMALLFLMEKYSFNVHLLHQVIANLGQKLNISFSNVQFQDIAPLVGLDHLRLANEMKTFPLHRSRIPTQLFRSIIEDLDAMILQYGPPIDHETEKARSYFLSPIFNHLVVIFQGAFRNKPESMLPGQITSQGRIEYYFKIFGAVAMVFIEIKKKIGDTGTGRLDAIAQVIAECDVCDWVNTQSDFNVPIYAILCDGEIFEFYQFISQASSPHMFSRGTYISDQPPYATIHRFRLPDLADSNNSLAFITALRPICELIFDIFLLGYFSVLEAHCNHSIQVSGADILGMQESDNLVAWVNSYNKAACARNRFRGAREACAKGQIIASNLKVESAMESLEERYGFRFYYAMESHHHSPYSISHVPIMDRVQPIIHDWDIDQVEMA